MKLSRQLILVFLGFLAWVGVWGLLEASRPGYDTPYGSTTHEAWVGARWGAGTGFILLLVSIFCMCLNEWTKPNA